MAKMVSTTASQVDQKLTLVFTSNCKCKKKASYRDNHSDSGSACFAGGSACFAGRTRSIAASAAGTAALNRLSSGPKLARETRSFCALRKPIAITGLALQQVGISTRAAVFKVISTAVSITDVSVEASLRFARLVHIMQVTTSF